MKELAQLLRDNAGAFRDRVHHKLFLEVLESRQIFSLSMERTHPDMAGALAWFLDHCNQWGWPDPAALQALDKLGHDHRRHGFPPETFNKFAECLIHGLDIFDLSASDRIAAEHAIAAACAQLADAAHAADLEGTAPAHQARVVEINRPNREIATVRLETSMPLDVEPGQYFPVTSNLLPGTWLQLAAAAPASAVGQLEFHVQAPPSFGLDKAALLIRAQAGEVWTLGTPRGTIAPASRVGGARVVFLCFGTGWAPVRAWLLHRVEAATVRGEDVDLEAAVYAMATSPGHHYDVDLQRNLMTLDSRLQLTHLVESAEDPWLLGAGPTPEDIDFVPTDNPVQEILGREDPRLCHFVVVGPAHLVDPAVEAFTHAGVPAAQIEAHPWAHGRDWDPS